MPLVRVNGFQCPLSRDQIKTIVLYPILTAGYYLLVCFVLIDYYELLRSLIAINTILFVLLLVAWVMVTYIDPERKEGMVPGLPVICFSPPEKSARFCGACRKTVSGLDHHCNWLNTCVGRRNYVPFICVVFIGATQSILQTAVAVTVLTVWSHDDEIQRRILGLFCDRMWFFYLVVSIYTSIAGVVAVGLLLLVSFHTYLMVYVHMGTYDWLLHRRSSIYDATVHDDRDPELSSKERQKQKEREEWQKTMNNPRRSDIIDIEKSYRIPVWSSKILKEEDGKNVEGFIDDEKGFSKQNSIKYDVSIKYDRGPNLSTDLLINTENNSQRTFRGNSQDNDSIHICKSESCADSYEQCKSGGDLEHRKSGGDLDATHADDELILDALMGSSSAKEFKDNDSLSTSNTNRKPSPNRHKTSRPSRKGMIAAIIPLERAQTEPSEIYSSPQRSRSSSFLKYLQDFKDLKDLKENNSIDSIHSTSTSRPQSFNAVTLVEDELPPEEAKLKILSGNDIPDIKDLSQHNKLTFETI